jgi:hypothetical protein
MGTSVQNCNMCHQSGPGALARGLLAGAGFGSGTGPR